MKFVMMSTRDSASELFSRPFFVAAVGAGVRGFTDEVNRKDVDNPLNAHPEHFDLYKVGFFDDITGTVESVIPEHVIAARDVVNKVVAGGALRSVN